MVERSGTTGDLCFTTGEWLSSLRDGRALRVRATYKVHNTILERLLEFGEPVVMTGEGAALAEVDGFDFSLSAAEVNGVSAG